MIRSLLFFILICTFTLVKGQYEPQFSQNMFNQLSVNPGFAGRSGQVGIVFLNRNQWVGFEGAPTTFVLGVDAGLKFMGFEHGVGFSALNDEIGSYSNKRFTLSYALKFDLAVGQISAGASFGFINQSLSGGDLKTDAKDNRFGAEAESNYISEGIKEEFSEVSGSSMDYGLGVYYKQKKFYGGISMLHINSPEIKLEGASGNLNLLLNRTLFITGGYTYQFLDRPYEIEPSFYIKTDKSSLQVDLNAIFKYRKKYWGGLTYRVQDAIVVLVGLEMKNGLKVGYSYDFTTSHLAGYQTHEVMFSYWFSLGLSKKSKQYRSVRYL